MLELAGSWFCRLAVVGHADILLRSSIFFLYLLGEFCTSTKHERALCCPVYLPVFLADMYRNTVH